MNCSSIWISLDKVFFIWLRFYTKLNVEISRIMPASWSNALGLFYSYILIQKYRQCINLTRFLLCIYSFVYIIYTTAIMDSASLTRKLLHINYKFHSVHQHYRIQLYLQRLIKPKGKLITSFQKRITSQYTQYTITHTHTYV